MQLTKEMILGKNPQLKEIEVPEWGGSVFIRPITLQEQATLADMGAKFERGSVVVRMKHVTLQLVRWAVVDGENEPIFDEKDVETLMGKTASAFLRLQDAILKYSGLTEKSREELEKNLSGQSDGQDSQ
jgi:hypothetical protein